MLLEGCRGEGVGKGAEAPESPASLHPGSLLEHPPVVGIPLSRICKEICLPRSGCRLSLLCSSVQQKMPGVGYLERTPPPPYTHTHLLTR